MTLESKVNVTILKSLLRLPSPTSLSFYRPRVFIFGILISYGVQITTKVSKYGNGFGSKCKGQIYWQISTLIGGYGSLDEITVKSYPFSVKPR